MRIARLGSAFVVTAVFLTATGCVTEIVDPNGLQSTEGPTLAQEVRRIEKQIERVVDAVSFDHGTKLLQDLQWLIAQRQLAVAPIIAVLKDVDDVTRGNLLYVLGFTRIGEATDALVENLASHNEGVRFEAAAGLLSHGDMTAIRILIPLLDSDNKHLRYKAIETLRGTTGRDLKYAFNAPLEERLAAVGRWQEWWKKESGRLMRRSRTRTGAVRSQK